MPCNRVNVRSAHHCRAARSSRCVMTPGNTCVGICSVTVATFTLKCALCLILPSSERTLGVTPVSGVCRSATDAIDPFRTLVVASVSVRFSSEVTILRFPFSVRVGPASSLSQHTGQTPTHGYASYTVHLGPRAGEWFAFRADRCACQTSAGGRKH